MEGSVWSTLGYVALATVVGSFAALWAQGAPVNRGMRSALYTTIGFVGGLLFLVSLVALATGFMSPWSPFVMGLAVSLPLWRRFRQAVARLLPIDPTSATHAVALVVVLALLLLSGAALLAIARGQPPALPAASPIESIAQHLALAVVSLFAVGLGLRRSWSATQTRLGLTWPGPLPAALGLGFGLAAALATRWAEWLTPSALGVTDRNAGLVLALGASPLAAGLVALSVAIGMELFFRGALQPRLGLPLTALTFVVVAAQGVAPLPLLALSLLAIGLGLLRRRASTIASIIAQGSYLLLLLVLTSRQ